MQRTKSDRIKIHKHDEISYKNYSLGFLSQTKPPKVFHFLKKKIYYSLFYFISK